MGDCAGQDNIDHKSSEVIALQGRNDLICELSAALGHYDVKNSVLSVPFSPIDICDDMTLQGTSARLRPFAEALDALRPLLHPKDGAGIADCGTGDHLQGLSLTDRMDLLDLVAAIRGVDSLFLGSAEKCNTTWKSQVADGDSCPVPPAASPPLQGSAGGLSRGSLASSYASMGSLPAASRLSELADEKLREIIDLQHRCDVAQGGEERLEAATLLAAAREELRLLREYAGLEASPGDGARTDHPEEGFALAASPAPLISEA